MPSPLLRVLFLGVLLALAPPTGAQTFRDGYRIDQFTTDHGLPAHSVHDIVQTADGMLWVATNAGLARFDGFTFRIVSSAGRVATTARISGLATGRGDTVWFADDAVGIGYVTRDSVRRLVDLGFAYDLEQADDGTLWIMSRGIRRFRDGSLTTVVPGDVDYSLTTIRPRIWRDAHGAIWIRLVDSAGYRIDRGVVSPVSTGASPVLFGNTTTGTRYEARRRGGQLEVLDSAGTVVYRPRVSAVDAVPRLVDRSGRLWVSTSVGLDAYDRGSPAPVAHVPIATGAIVVMFEDREGNVWAGTDVGGLWRLQRNAFQTIGLAEGLPPGPIASVHVGPDGHTVAIDQSRTGWLVDGHEVRPLRIPGVRRGTWLHHVTVDAAGTVWYAVEPELVGYSELLGFRPDGRRWRLRLSLVPNNIVEDPTRPGVLWVRSASELVRVEVDATSGPRIVQHWTLGRLGRGLLVARDGTVWASGDLADGTGALWRLTGNQLETFGAAEGLPPVQLRDLHEDSTGALWIGTYGAGLLRWQGGTIRQLTTAEGLGEDVVSGIADDGRGHLWFSGNRVVHRVALADLAAWSAGTASRVYATRYGRLEGLSNPEGSSRPPVRSVDGRLWFPTFGGVAVVNPTDALGLNTVPATVHIASVTADGERQGGGDTLRLPLGRRRLEIGYQAVAQRRPEAVTYEYRFMPLDTAWIPAGTTTSATWAGVPPGRYQFEVRARNAGGRPSTPATVMLVVPPYVWETWWFAVLVLFVAVGGATALYRRRERLHAARRTELSALVTARTAELANETRRAEEALATVAAQAEQLRTLDQAKSRFFANVSHEFRTPLSLVLGPLEDLRDGRDGTLSDAVARKLDRVIGNGRRLVRLVEQLLDVARLESGALRLDLEVRDLVPLLRRVTESFASMAERRGIDFRLSCPVGGVLVRFDPDQMDKVFANLLGNALKFTEPGGVVHLQATVETHDTGSWVVVSVSDTGVGIPRQKVARVFERFYQADDSPQRAHEGTGIGLAITKELLELHGGRIAVESREGVGTTFTLRLPMAPADARRLDETPPRGTPPRDAETSVEARPRAPSTGDDDQVTVLVCEDNGELRDYLREHLARAYRVIEAEDGHRGLAMARDHQPDLVISDIMMPGMDGQALCAAIKSDPETDFIPVILLTARASRESRLAGLTDGADDYLTKPVDIDELLVRARNLIDARRRLRERQDREGHTLPILALKPGAALEAGSQALLERLNAVLAANVADDAFGIDGLAKALAMSRATLYRRIEAATGLSPMDCLWAYRLDQAALWLRETDATVSEVAYAVGFKSVPHFSRRFRDRFGTSPSAYRQTSAT